LYRALEYCLQLVNRCKYKPVNSQHLRTEKQITCDLKTQLVCHFLHDYVKHKFIFKIENETILQQISTTCCPNCMCLCPAASVLPLSHETWQMETRRHRANVTRRSHYVITSLVFAVQRNSQEIYLVKACLRDIAEVRQEQMDVDGQPEYGEHNDD